MSRTAYLGLGANLGDRRGYLREAIARLDAAAGVKVRRLSRIYETEPVGIAEQPRFLNMVVEVELGDEVTPRDLLALVKRLETELGRQRRERWGPREIDIDILLIGEEPVHEPDLQVPHPEMWERAFVMVPLADLTPGLRGPSGETASEVARRLREGGGVDAEEA